MEATAEAAVGSAHTTPIAVRVRPFATGDEGRWDAFVDACASATFFHRAGWRDILENVFRHRCHYLIAGRGDEICGVLPLSEVRSRFFGHALVSLPFCVYGGPAANERVAENALIDAAVELARSLRVDHLELRNRESKRPDWPRQDLYVTFRRTLAPDVEANMQAIPRKQRAMVRKGIARGLRSEIDPAPERFFELYADNMHRHGSPALARRYFERLCAIFGEACEFMTVTTAEGRPVSSVLSFYFRDEVLPYYAGDTEEARELAANDFKYWALMRRACERGLRTFDYGRSKRGTGSFDFKMNWGFEPSPLAYEFQLLRRDSVPQNNPLNPKYRALIATWRHLPRAVVDVVGPLVARNLG
ncbi:MAG TPA: FemAB family XrtA/PEP-CTERM system-associated protein [Casimicrobiaceae bacterium]|nr:FemAB family XrtA/PEP-CTERM system-associated protein [Casimicrobiaceae bacterium]